MHTANALAAPPNADAGTPGPPGRTGPAAAPFSPRIRELHGRFVSNASSQHECADDAATAWLGAVRGAYRETQGEAPFLRRTRAVERIASDAHIHEHPEALLLGGQSFLVVLGQPNALKGLAEAGWTGDIGHLIHDYRALLKDGIDGRLARIRQRRRAASPAERTTLDMFERGLRAFQVYVRRHAQEAARLAKTLAGRDAGWADRAPMFEALVHEPAEDLWQALQMVWLTQTFLHAENPSSAISFGRLDQVLWPYARADLAAGRLTEAELRDLVAAFCLKCCHGDPSQNLALGGVDAEGRDAVNPLSSLFADVVGALRLPQPSLTVRWHAATDPRLLRAGCVLAATGIGQPGFVNDQAVIPGLQELGIPPERARDYGIVGCYEASPQGDCYANTVGCGLSLTRVLTDLVISLHECPRTFGAFRARYLDAIASDYRKVLDQAQRFWDWRRDNAPSPFGGALLGGCLEQATDMAAGGARLNLFGVNIHGLGSAVDGLHAIEQTVYRKRECTLTQIGHALACDFPDEDVRRRLRGVPGRYGTDSEGTNALVAWLSEAVARMVLNSGMRDGVRPYPAFFRWMAEVADHSHASPDGRRRSEHLSYGAGPSPATEAAPTAVLASARHVAHELCACGNPVSLNLPATDLCGTGGPARLAAMVETYFREGGFHVHVNAVDARTMRAAQQHPDQYRGLMVRISGLSAKFIGLDEELQDVLIDRAEHGY